MQKNVLAAKVVLITGAARRIGSKIAHVLHQEGMNVILHYNASEEEAVKLCEKFNHLRPHSSYAVSADLTVAENEKVLIQKCADIWGRLDVLVNNASQFYRTELGKVTEYAWNDLLNTNLKAPFFMAQAAMPFLLNTQGVIVNITDIHAEHPLRNYAVYSISKCGLVMMTKALAKELGPLIRVNAVAPGAIIWPEGENALSGEEKQKITNQIALRRAGEAEDIAKAVLFLIRDATYITGQVINVDGGRFL